MGGPPYSSSHTSRWRSFSVSNHLPKTWVIVSYCSFYSLYNLWCSTDRGVGHKIRQNSSWVICIKVLTFPQISSYNGIRQWDDHSILSQWHVAFCSFYPARLPILADLPLDHDRLPESWSGTASFLQEHLTWNWDESLLCHWCMTLDESFHFFRSQVSHL